MDVLRAELYFQGGRRSPLALPPSAPPVPEAVSVEGPWTAAPAHLPFVPRPRVTAGPWPAYAGLAGETRPATSEGRLRATELPPARRPPASPCLSHRVPVCKKRKKQTQ